MAQIEMTQSGSRFRLIISVTVTAIWFVITIAGGKILAPDIQDLGEGIKHGIAWNILVAAIFIAVAAAIFKWNDLKLVKPRPLQSLLLLWLPGLYILGFAIAAVTLGFPPLSVIFYVCLNTLIVGFSEEMAFRGVLFQGLRSRLTLWPAIILITLAFGGVHVANVVTTGKLFEAALQATTACMSGLVFIALLIRTGSIWVPIVYHWLWDFGTFLVSNADGHIGSADGNPSGLAYLIPIAFVSANFLYAVFLLRNTTNTTRLTTD